tara:strand:+ start:866 stop:1495 length:630 start_codon:yes stop_codon:yes gene_type:complete
MEKMGFGGSQREKMDMILEPMQVMIQLALLKNAPIGSKISVSNNILNIQKPTYAQGLVRWWNGDNKDDLYYLFHAIRRYYKWYKQDDNQLYNYILESAISGIDKLIQTYKHTDKTSIQHTLSLYKNVLDLESEQLFKDENEHTVNMDKVFKSITDLYDKKLLLVVYNILRLIDETENQTHTEQMSDALISLLNPLNETIRAWIQENLAI